MRRDSIFYKLFQQAPTLLFELLANPPENADAYRFDSVAVKEPKFEIDGVFLPPENAGAGIVYFCEVQFKKDEQLYERVFAESSLYFYRNRARFSDWQAVIIYPSRSIEQSDIYPHRTLLSGNQVHRVYLDELGDIRELPLWVALMVLTTVEEEQAPEAARYLLTKTRENVTSPSSRAIIEIITTIMVYKFERLNRREVETMLGITLKETRVYREIKDEGRQEEAANLISRQLTKRFGELSEEMRSLISGLPLPILEDLSEAFLDFTSLTDLQSWLEALEN
ncbi:MULTISPECIES: Rpn family recombination-promoting nuclease/putative transposase [unclassified Nodularia (in: cyanobacteria)]|uniref:Rpn family recombination-promoting nuclease/putative transposase n=1 Tax=unclassified Nodularia (in: cyanobacteria) TaxID=2656917 RepID=UPI00187FCD6A|nr:MULTISPECIES: Rpn family recombination-promoting nuclease/putative transposase [unclassified Nodularia (in: cyanobacteria)]MBE9199305.1 Rpn family recombination-promoting nuclease/putative transposase [Nodularia sp. LEGE 06071]MCC2693677.1 Rpn family recombination-promoting nuclease/putative transposase [Nodularia sp. LEGE 04288]